MQDDADVKKFDAHLFRRLVALLQPYRWLAAGAVALLLIGSLLGNATPRVIQYAIDGPIARGDFGDLWKPVALFFALEALSFAAAYWQSIATNILGQSIIRNLRLKLFAHIQSLSMRFYAKNPVGRLMSRVVSDTDVLNELFSSGLITVFGDVFTLFFVVGFMLSLSVKLTLLSLSVLPFVIVITWIFKLKIRDLFRKIRSKTADLNTHLQESINGISTLHLFNQEQNNADKFDVHNREYLGHYLKTIFHFSVFYPAMEVLSSVALCLILWYGGLRYLGEGITVGVLVAFIEYIRKLFEPIRDLAEKFNTLQNAMASSERVFDLLEVEEKISTPERPIPLPRPQGKIEFKNVSFSYNPGQPVLEKVSFTVEPGTTVAIVGPTGSGKTTLANLLSRLYEPDAGDILIDGVSTGDIDPSDLRKTVRTVSQDLFVFSDTIAENIRLWNPEISDEKIESISHHINADRFIRALPKGYSEVLMEKGASLSMGQRQLLSFARVLAYDPAIIILDEATSSIDPQTEQWVQEAIGKLTLGRTCIVIAHRFSTIQTADKILVLHHGKLVEEGTHDALMQREGIYYKLYRLQFEAGLSPKP